MNNGIDHTMRFLFTILLHLLLQISFAQQKQTDFDLRSLMIDSLRTKHLQSPEAKARDILHQKFLQDFEVAKQTRGWSSKADDEEVRVIVRLKSEPIGKSNRQARASKRLQIAEEHQRFIAQLQKEENNLRSGGSAPKSKIHFEYVNTFNGFALTTSKGMADKIKTFAMVSSVVEDRQVKAVDEGSNKIIGADKVWTDYGVTGKGITICIIDTGIDYNHPALGGGFGPSFKVISGYDFVNNDNDPMDDLGHGTHVAGIAAANGGGLKGVAPDAKLVAYKVLGADGFGYDSWVVAGIERSTDPDQNPNTNDALDVVNMSLGDTPSEDDPVVEALNNAVDLGIIFAVAAGNGYYNFTIVSPGIAEKAITVAATDTNDATAELSSKGPTQDLHLKPDVAAPGVEIYSSIPGGQFTNYSGTSMASPHVAGAIALLLEKHPGWTPEIVKAALMQSAKPSAESIWNQGAGRIDVRKAIDAEFVLTPGSLSLGVVEGTSLWQKTVTSKLYNLSNSTKDFSLATDGDIHNAAITISITPPNLSLAAGQAVDVSITFSVDPAALPKKYYKEGYFGSLVATSGNQSAKAPIALLNPKLIKLQFTGELPAVVDVLQEGYFPKYYFPTSNELHILLDSAQYDIVAQYRGADTLNYNYFVFAEGVSPDTALIFDKSMAKNNVNFSALDQNENALSFGKDSLALLAFFDVLLNYFVLPWYSYSTIASIYDTIHISNLNKNGIVFHTSGAFGNGPDEFYDVTVTAGKIMSDTTFTNDPNNYFELNMHAPQTTDSLYMIFFTETFIEGDWGFGIGDFLSGPLPISNSLKMFLSAPDRDQWGIISQSRAVILPKNQYGYGKAWETGFWKVKGDSLEIRNGTAYSSFNTVSATIPNKFDYYLGETLLRWNGKFNGNYVSDERQLGFFNRHFGERERGIVRYESKSANGTLLKSGSFVNRVFPEYWIGTFPASYPIMGDYSNNVHLTYEDYEIQGMPGKAEVSFYYGSGINDRNFPIIDMFSLEANGTSTNRLTANQQGDIYVTVRDKNYFNNTESGINSVALHYKKYGSPGWIALPLSGSDTNSLASLPTDLEESYYDLKLVVTDNAGNKVDYATYPAFLVGPAIDPSTLVVPVQLEPLNHEISVSSSPLFKWGKIAAAQSYTLQLFWYDSTSLWDDFFKSTMILPNLIKEITTSGTLFQSGVLPEGMDYFWRVRANYALGSSMWSPGFVFQTSGKYEVVLVSPANKSTVPPGSLNFTWEPPPFTNKYYTWEISTSPNFDTQNTQWLEVNENSYLFNDLLPDTTYYWRVSAYLDTYYYRYVTSDPFEFRTDTIAVEIPPSSEQRAYCYPNPFSNEIHIVFSVEKPSRVNLTIVNLSGQEIETIVRDYTQAGDQVITWDGSTSQGHLTHDGLYIGVLQSDGKIEHVKMVLKR